MEQSAASQKHQHSADFTSCFHGNGAFPCSAVKENKGDAHLCLIFGPRSAKALQERGPGDGISSPAFCLVQCLLAFQGLGFSARHKWKKWPLPLGEGAKISTGKNSGLFI